MLTAMSTALTRLQQELDLNRVGAALESYLVLLESSAPPNPDRLEPNAWREVKDAHRLFHLPIRSLVLGLDFALHLIEDDNILFQVLVANEMPEAYQEELQAWKTFSQMTHEDEHAVRQATLIYVPYYLQLREELQHFITLLAQHKSAREDEG